jgi:integrase
VAITVRRRGKYWHARGVVRVGKEVIDVAEFSTGQDTRAGARHVAEVEARRIREEHLEGAAGRARRLTVGACFAAYLSRPGGVRSYDVVRVAEMNEVMGAARLADTGAAWQDWLERHRTMAPATVQRWRTIMLAALKMGCEANGVPVPKLPSVKQDREVRQVYLTEAERGALLAAYPEHAGRVALVLAYQGLRTQEALQLDWRHVDLVRETIHVPPSRSKSGRGRTVPMHPRVVAMLAGLRAGADRGHVFLNRRGEPYQDTPETGGNPLKTQHARACRKAGVTGFRVHDWRHDWAARHVMAGTDFYTLMKLGGWSSLRMVERYAAVSAEHMKEAVRRIG